MSSTTCPTHTQTNTLLQYYCQTQQAEQVKSLLQTAKKDITTLSLSVAIDTSIESGSPYCLDALMCAGAKVKIPACFFHRQCHQTDHSLPAWYRYRHSTPYQNGTQWHCLQTLLQRDWRLKEYCFFSAVLHNDPTWLIKIIRCGQDILAKDPLGFTATDIATHYGFSDIMQILEDHLSVSNQTKI